MSRFLVALRLAVLALSRSWFFLAGLLPSLLTLGAAILVTAGLSFYPAIETGNLEPFGYLAAAGVFTFLVALALLLGVIAVKRELRERSVKMLLCRPVGFHQWLASRFLAGAVVLAAAAVANAAGLAAFLAASGWTLRFEHAVMACLTFSAVLALYAYAAFLSTFLHEIPAAVTALVVNGPLFRGAAYLVVLIAHGVQLATEGRVQAEMVAAFFRAAYIPWPDTFQPTSLFSFINLDPTSHPFAATFLVDATWSILYAINLILIFYAASAAILRRRNLT